VVNAVKDGAYLFSPNGCHVVLYFKKRRAEKKKEAVRA
jgi:hypothetical protein